MTKPGHNSGKGGPIDPAKLKSYVERIEAVEAEEADYKAAKKDIYVEVKAAGMRPKMVRKIVKERKKTESDAEDEAELELYRAALAMPGATYRSVAEKTGASKSKLQRLVPRKENGTSPAHDADGVITETEESCGDAGSASATHNSHHVGHAEGAVAAPPVSPHDTDVDLTIPAHLRGPSPANRRAG